MLASMYAHASTWRGMGVWHDQLRYGPWLNVCDLIGYQRQGPKGVQTIQGCVAIGHCKRLTDSVCQQSKTLHISEPEQCTAALAVYTVQALHVQVRPTCYDEIMMNQHHLKAMIAGL